MDQDSSDIDLGTLRQIFQVESSDFLASLEADLLALEQNPGDLSKVEAMFRAAHTIKGGARVVGLNHAAEFTHVFEDLLEQLRKGEISPSSELTTLGLRAVDALRTIVASAAGGADRLSADDEALVMDLRSALSARQTPAAGGGGTEATAPAPLGGRAADDTPRTGATIRVSLDKLDRLLDLVGEIAIFRGRITDMLESGEDFSRARILDARRESDLLYQDLQALVMKVRMVPLGPLFRESARTVRDLGVACGKSVRLVIEGEDVEVDTRVVEHLRDPLTHLIRNAVTHGIEESAARIEAGKPPVGKVLLKAFHDAGGIVVKLHDDGKGLDRERILERARKMDLVAPAGDVPGAEIYRMIFEPGLSTADEVSEISGRGVGMDVVKRNVEQVHGSVAIESVRGEGTTVSLRLPLTLAIIDGFRVAAGGETYVVPVDSIAECTELLDKELVDGIWGVAKVREKPLPYLSLRRMFGLGGRASAHENLLVIRDGEMEAGLAVDSLLGEAQTVIKPLPKLFRGVPGLSGTTIMGSGRVAFVLDVPALLNEAMKKAGKGKRESLEPRRNAMI